MSELFDAVDALIASASPLPPPAERERLRKAHGLTQDQVATALKVRRPTVVSWENGKTEPRPPQREAYARLLSQLAELYPANTAAPAPVTAPEAPARVPAPQALAAPAPGARTAVVTEAAAAQPATPAPPRSPSPAKPSTSRRPVSKKAAPKSAPAAVDPRFANGPLAVVDVADGQVSAYCIGGLILDVPAKTIPALVEWTLSDAQLGAARLHPLGKDSDPLIVLTAASAERYGLPVQLTDEQRRGGRLPEGHKILKQLEKADWRLTQRGFGPWARIYRPAQNGKRRCVQLSLVSWGALDPREWEHAAELPPAELARVLGTYATRVMTPRGTSAVNGLELMTALRPASRRARDERTGEYAKDPESGGYLREAIAGSLPETVLQAVPCEVPDGHPLLADLPRFHQRTPADMLMEEAYDWCRPLTDDECLKSHVVGIDVNMAFAAAANGTTVGLGAPVHVNNPVFDPKMPGSWLVDLSHITFDDRLPSPFTPKGTRPQGPAWYATPTVAYAVELGHDVAPIEAYIRPENGRYLDPWYTRLRDAYLATMADLGVVSGMDEQAFLDAMQAHKQIDPELALVLRAIKATVKGGIGKLRERPRGQGWRPGMAWPALSRPTWRPDIRAAVIATTRVNMHRKMMKLALAADLYPVAIGTDCIVYPSDGPSPLDFLPRTPDGTPLPGAFRLGVSPGMVKHEGTQTVLWAEAQGEQYGPDVNIARSIKDGGASAADDGE